MDKTILGTRSENHFPLCCYSTKTIMMDPRASAGESLNYFGWPDYLVFASMLIISLAIGIYYGCTGSKQSTTAEFFVGGRSMGVFPVAMSLAAR